MEAFYKRHAFPATKAAKVVQDPDESQGPELGVVVPVEEGGSALNKSYAMSDREDDDSEEEGGAGAAAGGAEPAAAAAAVEPAAAANSGPD